MNLPLPHRGALLLLLVLFVSSLQSEAAEGHPLEPLDTSSPRNTITEFFTLADDIGRAAVAYREVPGRTTFLRMEDYVSRALRLFDLSLVPATAQEELGSDLVIHMWEVLSRIELPLTGNIPDQKEMKARIQEGEPAHYTIPHTDITIARVEAGERVGEYLFSPSTVRQLGSFYDRVKHLPYSREMAIERPWKMNTVWGGWLLMPPQRAEALPDWLKAEMGGQALWKWIAQTLLFALVFGMVWLAHRLATRATQSSSLGAYLRPTAAPGTFLLLVPLMNYMWSLQIGITGLGGTVVQVGVPALTYFAMAWVVWCTPLFIAEAIIASPRIPAKGVDAHLLRLVLRVVGLMGVVGILFWGGNRLGLPLYGLIAGVGVGGLAIALAAQGTLENFLGSLNLFADRPVRVGDFCRYGDQVGTIEEIGLRSTRVRGLDRTVTSIPNADFARMHISNFTRRERMLLRTTIGLRYETTPEQLRHVLAKLRKLLLAHPKVTPEPARARFLGFGDCSLNLEVFAYVATHDWNEFLEIQEDVNFRIMEVVAASGTGFAFPSQTLYLTRDQGLDPERTAAASAEVQAWRDTHKLPFPDFDLEFRKQHRDTLDYPPSGSATAEPKEEG